MTLASESPAELLPEPLLVDSLTPADRRDAGTVARALRVLDAFGGRGTVYGVSELARRCGLPKSTTYRMMKWLAASGYLRRNQHGFSLSHHMLTLSSQYDPAVREAPNSIAAPHLGGLFLKTGFAVNLATLSGIEVVYLSQIQGPRVPRLPVGIGGRMPAHTTALGKATLAFSTREQLQQVLEHDLPRRTRNSVSSPGMLLAQLKAARAEGVAYDHQECELGLVCVAAPIVVPGRMPLAVSVSGPSAQVDLSAAAKLVQQTARDITAELLERYGPHAED